jgi:hypothetical protein
MKVNRKQRKMTDILNNIHISKVQDCSNHQSRFRKSIFLTLLMLLALHSYSQTRYLIKDEAGFDFILNVTTDGNRINGFTRERALTDYASWLNYRMIRLATPLKNSEIIRFRATLTDENFEGTYDYLFSSYRVLGSINEDTISYSLFHKNNELHRSFKGKRITEHIKKDYVQLAEDVIRITEENIFNPEVLQSKNWNNFRKRLLSAAPDIADDLEFQIGFFALVRNIGFSHYYFVPNISFENRDGEKPFLNEIDENTVLLRIPSFSEKKENIIPLLDTVRQKAYDNLIIDLRNNGGGSFEPAFPVGNFLTDKELISGFFPGRNWYKEYNRPPNRSDIDKFSQMLDGNLEAQSKYGYFIATTGENDSFKGKVYILVNNRTGSTAEVLTIAVKEHSLATVVGQRTYGTLLAAQGFNIDDDIMLAVPVNDFISYNGCRVEQKGIEPDIKTKRDKELERVLEMIK